MRYCVWNNKGGVGKTFLTYCLSTVYAARHPEKKIVVVDMCPQANVSEMLLGGNGLGEDNLYKCFENSRTIASYIKSRYDRSRFGKIGNEISYFVKVSDFNVSIPDNLYLLPGDIDLDICSSIIDHMARGPEKQAWEKSRRFLSDLMDVFGGENKNTVFFIDSNPSFASYTQLGLIASDRIIVPCTADSASIRGIYNILRLVFGAKETQSPDDDIFDEFYLKIRDMGTVPKIHSFVLNKARTKNSRSTKAYQAHVDSIGSVVRKCAKLFPDCFCENPQVYDMKDCNTLAPVINYNGLSPLSLTHTKYEVYDEKTQVNQSQIDTFMDDLNKVVDSIK